MLQLQDYLRRKELLLLLDGCEGLLGGVPAVPRVVALQLPISSSWPPPAPA